MKRSITSPRRGQAPAGTPRASGTFLLRLDPRLHEVLRQDAAAAGTSLNDWCGRALAAPAALDGAADVLIPLRKTLGADLLGVVVYGSFSRGQLASGSDIDLLVVVSAGVPITRSLYREWEGAVPRWQGREVDLHFVHLPAAGAAISGSWAEAAVCGIVLHDRELFVSRRLIEIRGRIAAGEMVRRMAQGQPYWVHEADHAQP
jgi:predicted nucleotidyltransferase